MTIALLCHLADSGMWGPHLIVAPSSVVLNWDVEFKRWAPGLKVVPYLGSAKQRRNLRKGWSTGARPVVSVITSYQIAMQDYGILRRIHWTYLVLDEAHYIKNQKSARWDKMKRLNADFRLLLSGTPLQNNVMELFSLLHFLMPTMFQSDEEFRKWYSDPLDGATISGMQTTTIPEETLRRLHTVLKPFILRRLKSEVEKQLPSKTEHIVSCGLSRRQRHLYEDFMSRADTRETLASQNVFGMLNVLMQLRKVCNHPDLFESRPIESPWAMDWAVVAEKFRIPSMTLSPADQLQSKYRFLSSAAPGLFLINVELMEDNGVKMNPANICLRIEDVFIDHSSMKQNISVSLKGKLDLIDMEIRKWRISRRQLSMKLSRLRCSVSPLIGRRIVSLVETLMRSNQSQLITINEYSTGLLESCNCFRFLVNKVSIVKGFGAVPSYLCNPGPTPPIVEEWNHSVNDLVVMFRLKKSIPIHNDLQYQRLLFPDKSLLIFDCGKLQTLGPLLLDLVSNGHRILLFTQMSRMLDILEKFLCMLNIVHLRMDGATKPEDRQRSVQRFNLDDRISAFLLTTRTGGFGINLVGADTVIFYDSDWNPAMDAQAQDRCHRIGQTRNVHIYRLVSSHTVEENIVKKATQKQLLTDAVLEDGRFQEFARVDVREFFEEIVGQTTNVKNEDEKQVESAMNDVEDEADRQATRAVTFELMDMEAQLDNVNAVHEGGMEKTRKRESVDEDLDGLLTVETSCVRYFEEVEPVVDREELVRLESDANLEEEEKRLEAEVDRLAERMGKGRESFFCSAPTEFEKFLMSGPLEIAIPSSDDEYVNEIGVRMGIIAPSENQITVPESMAVMGDPVGGEMSGRLVDARSSDDMLNGEMTSEMTNGSYYDEKQPKRRRRTNVLRHAAQTEKLTTDPSVALDRPRKTGRKRRTAELVEGGESITTISERKRGSGKRGTRARGGSTVRRKAVENVSVRMGAGWTPIDDLTLRMKVATYAPREVSATGWLVVSDMVGFDSRECQRRYSEIGSLVTPVRFASNVLSVMKRNARMERLSKLAKHWNQSVPLLVEVRSRTDVKETRILGSVNGSPMPGQTIQVPIPPVPIAFRPMTFYTPNVPRVRPLSVPVRVNTAVRGQSVLPVPTRRMPLQPASKSTQGAPSGARGTR